MILFPHCWRNWENWNIHTWPVAVICSFACTFVNCSCFYSIHICILPLKSLYRFLVNEFIIHCVVICKWSYHIVILSVIHYILTLSVKSTYFILSVTSIYRYLANEVIILLFCQWSSSYRYRVGESSYCFLTSETVILLSCQWSHHIVILSMKLSYCYLISKSLHPYLASEVIIIIVILLMKSLYCYVVSEVIISLPCQWSHHIVVMLVKSSCRCTNKQNVCSEWNWNCRRMWRAAMVR